MRVLLITALTLSPLTATAAFHGNAACSQLGEAAHAAMSAKANGTSAEEAQRTLEENADRIYRPAIRKIIKDAYRIDASAEAFSARIEGMCRRGDLP